MKSRIWIAAAVLVLAALACSPLAGGNPTPGTEQEQQEATSIASPGASPGESTPADEAGVPEIDPEALSGLNSYRVRWVMQWTPDGGTPEGITMIQEYTREPEAARTVIESPQGDVEVVQVEGTTWSCFGGTCMQTQTSEEDLISQSGMASMDPGDFASSEMTYVNQESVNGVATRHYALKLTGLEFAALAQGEVSDVQGDVWIADDPGLPTFVVRYTVVWTETREGQEGSSEFSYEVYDVNAPFTIEPPEGTVGLPEDLPMYPDAANLTVMEGFISFSSTDDVATVADFYRAELPAMGWANQSDDTMGTLVSQMWTKEAQTMNLVISPEGDGATVLITLE